MSGKTEKLQWHPAFCAATELEMCIRDRFDTQTESVYEAEVDKLYDK